MLFIAESEGLEEQNTMMDQRLASRLSTPAGQTRSSRKSRTSKSKLIGDSSSNSNSGLDTSTSTGTTMSSSPHSSWSSLGMDATGIGLEDADTANKLNQIQITKDAFDDIQQKLEDEVKRAKSIPTISAEPIIGPPKTKFRRARSDSVASIRRSMSGSVLETLTEMKDATTTPKPRKSVMGSKSMRTSRPKSPCNKNGKKNTSDHSKKSNNSESNQSGPTFRRTMSNKSGTRRNTARRASIGTSTTPTKTPTSCPYATTASSAEGTWTCKCGYVLKDRYSFCGMCGLKKLWTCEECQFTENLSQFNYCGNCGVPRDLGEDSSHSSLPDPFLNLKTTPPKLVTMFE